MAEESGKIEKINGNNKDNQEIQEKHKELINNFQAQKNEATGEVPAAEKIAGEAIKLTLSPEALAILSSSQPDKNPAKAVGEIHKTSEAIKTGHQQAKPVSDLPKEQKVASEEIKANDSLALKDTTEEGIS